MSLTPYNPLEFDPARKTARYIRGVSTAAMVLVMSLLIFNLFDHVNADQILVVQAPISGRLTWYTSAGVKWQGFGRVTHYRKRTQFWFSNLKDQGEPRDQSIKVRFNDGGHATISGSVAWEMPLDAEHLTAIHTRYGSQEAVEQQLVRTVLEKAVYMTGPLMSSKESYAERRNDLIKFIDDQLTNGVYQTQTRETKEPDPITGQPKTVRIVELVERNGRVLREDVSTLSLFGIKAYNLSLNEIAYDNTVEAQIQQQQAAIMQVQTALAEAKKAEQAAITAQKNGEAEAARAKWEQEVIKAKAVTEAQQKLEVARLDAQAADQYKLTQTRRAEGDAEYKRKVMAADGALQQKLDALVKINQFYAEALRDHPTSWVPSVVMGNQPGTPGGSALPLIDLLTAKTAKELGIELEVTGAQATARPQR